MDSVEAASSLNHQPSLQPQVCICIVTILFIIVCKSNLPCPVPVPFFSGLIPSIQIKEDLAFLAANMHHVSNVQKHALPILSPPWNALSVQIVSENTNIYGSCAFF